MHVRLMPRLVWGDVDVTDTPFMLRYGADFGSGANLYEILETELFDGGSVQSDSTENRTITFEVAIIDEPDMAGLELAGARLDREAEKARNLLTFDPGDGFGTPWAVETYRAQTRMERLDEFEQALVRIYTIEMQAHPHVRSVDPVIVPATGSGESVAPPVLVDAPSDTSGWSATVAGASVTPAFDAGVKVSAPILRTQLLTNPLFMAAWQQASMPGWGMRSDTYAQPTAKRGEVAITSTTAAGQAQFFSAYVPVTAGLSYTASGHFASPQGGVAAGSVVRIFWYNASSGAPIAAATSTAMGANPNGFHSVTGTAPVGATRARWGVEASFTGSARRDLIASQVLFERASSRQTWFSGDSPVAGGAGYRWTGTPGYSTSVQVPAGVSELTRTGLSADFTGTRFAHVTYRASHDAGSIDAWAGAAELPKMTYAGLGGDRYVAVFDVGDVAVTSLRFALGSAILAAPEYFTVSRIERSGSSAPYVGTGRQTFQSFPVHGTGRTAGSLHVGHEMSLGSTLVCTFRDDGSGHIPAQRANKVGGGVDVIDPDAASGACTSLAAPFYVTPPISSLTPGEYLVLARLRAATAGSANFQITASTSGSTVATLPTVTWVERRPITTGYTVVDLGTVTLPTASTGASSLLLASVSVQAVGTAETGQIDLDDLYLCNVSTGSVTAVDAGNARHLWLNAPTVERPFPSLMGGILPDGSDAVSLSSKAALWMPAAWEPGEQKVFVVSLRENAVVEASYFPRFLHNAYTIAAA